MEGDVKEVLRIEVQKSRKVSTSQVICVEADAYNTLSGLADKANMSVSK